MELLAGLIIGLALGWLFFKHTNDMLEAEINELQDLADREKQ